MKHASDAGKAGVTARFWICVCVAAGLSACDNASWPPGVQPIDDESPVLSPEEALQRFVLPPGYSIELVASEPLVQDPVAIDFDADGRMWVVEMRAYLSTAEPQGEQEPIGRIVIVEDLDDDGRMDTSTVYLDGLVLPRAVKTIDGGALVAAPPNLWLALDTDGDLRADSLELIADDFGSADGNPEFNANGLLWGIDNRVHVTHHGTVLRLDGEQWTTAPSLKLGQWGISMDDYGRIYRNYSEQPLQVDLVPAAYYSRNPNLTRTRGAYERAFQSTTVWPLRPNRGVNRGDAPGVLRQDGTLSRYTAGGAPVAYRGDRLPQELRNDVFVTEPAGNLVQRLQMREMNDGSLRGRNPYHEQQAEFLASTDERFRPVNLYSAPDGTLYVVDMYRGVIQHDDFQTQYLRDHIEQAGLERPLGLGRIYRVVHDATERAARPRLSGASAEELVSLLSHPNGWWRDTAQRLLVVRSERSAAQALRELFHSAEDDYVRLHALWTLDGLSEADESTLLSALADSSAHVIGAAIRISERWLSDSAHAVTRAVLELLEGSAPSVTRQIAASLGALPADERMEPLVRLIAEHGGDPIVVDATLSSLHGNEVSFLQSLITDERFDSRSHRAEVVAATVATIFRGADASETLRLIDWMVSADLSAAQRSSVLDGFETTLAALYALRLDAAPDSLIAASQDASSDIAARYAAMLDKIVWPGKSDQPEEDDPRPLMAAEVTSLERGRQIFADTCAPCHQSNGTGIVGVAPPLVGSRWVLGEPSNLARILLHGLTGTGLMPSLRTVLSDTEIADVLTYLRRDWGHRASVIPATTVREIRDELPARQRPWTAEELESLAQ